MTQVGVDDSDNRRPRRLEPLDDRRPEAELAAPVDDLDAVTSRKIVGQCAGAVRRVVVDDDELAVDAPRAVRRKHGGNEIPEPIALVVGRNDDGQRWGQGDGHGMRGGQKMRLESTITQPALAFLPTISPRAS